MIEAEPPDDYLPRHRAAGWAQRPAAALVIGMATAIVLIGVIATVALTTGGTPTSAAPPPSPMPLAGAPVAPSSAATAAAPPPSATRSPHPTPSHSPRPSISPSPHPSASPGPSASPSPSASSSPSTSGELTARYRTTDSWNGGYVGTITLTATGGSVAGWSLTLSLPVGAAVTGFWGGQDTVDGSTVSVTPASWDSMITPGSPVSVGFQVSQQGRPRKPLSCTVSGRPCDGL